MVSYLKVENEQKINIMKITDAWAWPSALTLCRRLCLQRHCLLLKDRLGFTIRLLHVRTDISFHMNSTHFSKSHCISSFWNFWLWAGKLTNDIHVRIGICFCMDRSHFPRNSYRAQFCAWEDWSWEILLNLYLHNCHSQWSSRMWDLLTFYVFFGSLIS